MSSKFSFFQQIDWIALSFVTHKLNSRRINLCRRNLKQSR